MEREENKPLKRRTGKAPKIQMKESLKELQNPTVFIPTIIPSVITPIPSNISKMTIYKVLP